MANITLPVDCNPFLKTSERPLSRIAGEAFDQIEAVYYKTSVQKYFVGTTDPAAVTAGDEPYIMVGISLSIAETDSYVTYVTQQGTIIDFGTALTDGTQFYFNRTGIGLYSDVTTGDYLCRAGFADENGDFVVDIFNQLVVKD